MLCFVIKSFLVTFSARIRSFQRTAGVLYRELYWADVRDISIFTYLRAEKRYILDVINIINLVGPYYYNRV